MIRLLLTRPGSWTYRGVQLLTWSNCHHSAYDWVPPPLVRLILIQLSINPEYPTPGDSNLAIPTIWWLRWMTQPHSTTAANICRACQMRKGYDNPGRVSFQLGLYFLCHAPDPYGSEHLFHRERPVASQHSLRNCVDHLAALPTQAIRFDVNVTCYAPLSASQGAKTR